jgi:hypothetical protein
MISPFRFLWYSIVKTPSGSLQLTARDFKDENYETYSEGLLLEWTVNFKPSLSMPWLWFTKEALPEILSTR